MKAAHSVVCWVVQWAAVTVVPLARTWVDPKVVPMVEQTAVGTVAQRALR